MTQRRYTVVKDPTAEQTAPGATAARVWHNPFTKRPVRLIREFVINGLREWPVEPILTEAPSAEEMARLSVDVMHLNVEQLASVLKTPVGAVGAWLNPESGSRPTPETATEPPEFKWDHWLALWSLARWWETLPDECKVSE